MSLIFIFIFILYLIMNAFIAGIVLDNIDVIMIHFSKPVYLLVNVKSPA